MNTNAKNYVGQSDPSLLDNEIGTVGAMSMCSQSGMKEQMSRFDVIGLVVEIDIRRLKWPLNPRNFTVGIRRWR